MTTILLKWRYNYLYLWKFLEQVIKQNDLSQYVKPIKLPTSQNNFFELDQKRVKYLLREIYENKNKKNMFGYLNELSAIKWILWAMKEILDDNWKQEKNIKKQLWSQFFPFWQIIRLARNVITHSNTTNLVLQVENFANQRDYLLSKNIQDIHFKLQHKDLCRENISIKINFSKLISWQPFNKLITIHELYLLCELCYNLCK